MNVGSSQDPSTSIYQSVLIFIIQICRIYGLPKKFRYYICYIEEEEISSITLPKKIIIIISSIIMTRHYIVTTTLRELE